MDLSLLCEIQAVSGREELLRRHLYEECIQLLGKDNVRIDKAGNIIAHQAGSDTQCPPLMLLSHMDENGLMAVSATEDGLIRVEAVGRTDSRMIISKHVKVGYPQKDCEPIDGVIGATAIHLQNAQDRLKVLPMDKVYVDIGAKDKAEAMEKVPMGTPITFASGTICFGCERMAAKALPARAGIWNMLRLMENPHKRSADYVFAGQTEVGGRGALGAVYALNAEECIVLDGIIANDGGGDSEKQPCAFLEKGVCIDLMENRTIPCPELLKTLSLLAEKEHILYQFPASTGEGQDLEGIQFHGSGVRAITLSIPARNLYSPLCVCSMKDIKAQYDLLSAYLS